MREQEISRSLNIQPTSGCSVVDQEIADLESEIELIEKQVDIKSRQLEYLNQSIEIKQ